MKRIDSSKVMLCDIVLTTTTNLKPSAIIRKAMNSDISHASIMVDYHSLIDSTGDGVLSRNTQKIFFDDSCPIYLLRYKYDITDAQKQIIIEYVRSLIGMQYSAIQAIHSWAKKINIEEKHMFCSRLVAKAYEAAGIKLVKDPSFCTPEELKQSEMISIISDSEEKISEEECRLIINKRNLSEEMNNRTVSLLKQVREINKNINTINDIDEFLIKNPQYDKAIHDAYKNSGYLNLWKEEIDENPHQHSVEGIIQAFGVMAKDYCYDVLREDTSRYEINLKGYKRLNNKYRHNTFREMVRLYENLYMVAKRRKSIAKEVLEIIG